MIELADYTVSTLESLASRVPERKETDFERDGVLICGDCGEAKQAWIDWIPDANGVSEKRLVPVMCRCEQERWEAEHLAFRREQFRYELQRMREQYGLFARGTEAIRFAQDDGSNAAISNACRKYVACWPDMLEQDIGILFYGNKGTGKTFYAACIANELAETRMVPTLVVTTAALIGAAQGKTERGAIIEHLRHFGLVVLDDLGAERDTSYGAEVLYGIIDARYRSGLPLIVTTNLDEADMREDADAMRSRIYDRVLEMCAVPIPVKGESRRGGIAERRKELAREILRGRTT